MTEPKRAMIAIRVNETALAEVDMIASQNEWTRSQVVRKLLSLGLREWRSGQR